MTHPLSIAFVWHMHQPYYRDVATGACSMPWVRLHATKDYLAMLRRLETFPTLHQTFNMVPSLLDQFEEYLSPSNQSDDFLDLSVKPAAELSDREQQFMLQWFFLANVERMIKPHPRYHDLLAKRGLHVSEEDWPIIRKRFHVQDYLDLQVWFNLVWIDPWLRSQDAQLAKLETKGSHFTEEEKRYVLEHHRTLMANVIPAYRDAATRGQIEVTTSPYYHPIVPLLCDLRSAHAALPHLTLPGVSFHHPDDVRWQLQQGLLRHHAVFGQPPNGMWPPEGSVSEECVKIALESKIQWIATDEEILWRTLKRARSPSLLYRPHVLRRKGGQLAIIFRDRELSDLLGFVYSQWDADIAVADFLKRLGEIHQQFKTAAQPALVSLILDGENAWEFYPQDGHAFLMRLYDALSNDARFRCVTVSEFLKAYPLQHQESLPELFSGSWIDGNFATWVGHPEKNAAWQALSQAREALASVSREDAVHAKAWKSFGAAEGSDWMWWFGDTHFSAQVEEFDRLFRTHLSNSYRLAGLEPPAELKAPMKRRILQPLYEPTGFIHPTIDGRETSYYEWLYAGRFDLKQQYAAIHRGEQYLWRVHYGFDQTHHYLRIDVDPAMTQRLPSWRLELQFSHGVQIHIAHESTKTTAHVRSQDSMALTCAFERVLEIAVPLQLFGLRPGEKGEKLELSITLTHEGKLLERYPAQGTLSLSMLTAELEGQTWSV